MKNYFNDHRENRNSVDVVAEAVAEYISRPHTTTMHTTYKKTFEDPHHLEHLSITEAIKEDMFIALFNLIKIQTPFSDGEWASFLNITKCSLDCFKLQEDHVFKSIQSEKIFQLAEVVQLGTSVFDTRDIFYKWLTRKNFTLGDHRPIDLLSNSYGKDLVVDELRHIDQGIFA